jgi:hypothetical protein
MNGCKQQMHSVTKAGPGTSRGSVHLRVALHALHHLVRLRGIYFRKAKLSAQSNLASYILFHATNVLSVPGQEEGNVPFVENAGFGKYSSDPQVIAETVSSWLASSDTMARLQNAALNAARPSATLDIAKDLAKMVFEAKMKTPQLVKVSSKRA